MHKMISITENGGFISNEPLTAFDFINITLSAQLNMFNNVLDQAETEEERTQVQEMLYDAYNKAASSFLEVFAPEIELRPDLTAEAILRAENEILKEQAEALKDLEEADEDDLKKIEEAGE